MAFLPPAIFEIKAVADKAIAEFKQVNNELGKMEGQAEKAGGSIGRIDKASRIATAGLLATGAAFAGFAALGIKEAMQAETIMTKLNATLAAQGLNTAATREEINKLSSSFVKLGFDDEAAAASMQVLIQSTGDLTKSKELLAMSADLARAKSISLESASQMLVRANMGAGKVFKQFGIVLDSTLPKAEATTKAMGELQSKLSGQALKATETFSVQLQILKEQFNNAAQAVGEVLIPYLKSLMENLNKAIEFVKRNSTAFQIFGGIVLTVTVALASYAVTLKVITAATKIYAAVQAVVKTATMLLTGQQIALNTAMAANPIGLIVAAAVLLIGALALLWNKSETFRKMIISVGKAGLVAFGFLIKVVGVLVEAFANLVTGPLKLFLKVLGFINPAAKEAYEGLKDTTNGIGKFFDGAAAKVEGFSKNLDNLNKPIKIKFLDETPIDFGNSTKGKGKGKGLTPEQKKAQEEVKKANEDYIKIVKDLNEKIISAQTKFNEKMSDIDVDYKDTIAKAQTDFNDKMADLNLKKSEDMLKTEQDNTKKIADIYKSYYDKLQSVVQQSVDRLRDAFRKGTEINPADIFKGLVEAGTANVNELLKSMQAKLAASKNLAKNAALLQANGFSQTFIEQIVAAGPEIGNQLAESILNSSPQTMKELQSTFISLEKISNTGLDALANEMNKGGKLATDELSQAYKQADIDLADALKNQAELFADAQSEININFDRAMAEAEKTRDSAISEAYKDMVKAQAEARKELADSLADIEKDMIEKLGSITNATNATISAIEALSAALNNAKTFTAPTVPIPAQNDSAASYTMADALQKTGALNETEYMRESGGRNLVINAPVTNYNTTSPEDIGNTFVRIAKYGMAVI